MSSVSKTEFQPNVPQVCAVRSSEHAMPDTFRDIRAWSTYIMHANPIVIARTTMSMAFVVSAKMVVPVISGELRIAPLQLWEFAPPRNTTARVVKKMLSALGIGLGLVAATVSLHTLGTSMLLRNLKRFADVPARSLWRNPSVLLAITATAIVMLHILEVLLWTLAYQIFAWQDLRTFENAFYFSSVTYTSLGYGDVVLRGNYRVLSGVQAMVGLLMFGWSSALFFTVVQRLWHHNASLDNPSDQATR